MIFYDKEFLGKKFKEYRKLAKMTQEELSEKVGIAEKHYGKLERGEFMPSLETFFKLVEVLEIPINEFGFKIDNSKNENTNREKLLKEIYSSNNAEIEFYLDFVKSLKTYNSKT